MIEGPRESVGPNCDDAAGDDILDQASGGVKTNTEPVAPVEPPNQTEPDEMSWEAMYKALGLNEKKYNAILNHVGGDWQEAYKFASRKANA